MKPGAMWTISYKNLIFSTKNIWELKSNYTLTGRFFNVWIIFILGLLYVTHKHKAKITKYRVNKIIYSKYSTSRFLHTNVTKSYSKIWLFKKNKNESGHVI